MVYKMSSFPPMNPLLPPCRLNVFSIFIYLLVLLWSFSDTLMAAVDYADPPLFSEQDGMNDSVSGMQAESVVEPPRFKDSIASIDDSTVSNILSHSSSSVPSFSLSASASMTKREEGLAIEASTVKKLMENVLRIHVVKVIPDFGMAWANKGEARSTGSGFPISGRRIITNAHVTTYAHLIRVEVPGSPELFDARVISMVHEPDLCVLTVDADNFWENLVPLEFAKGDDIPVQDPNALDSRSIPNLLDGVYVVGYPTGGDSLSVTQGIVSRVEVGFYSHSSAYLLEIQIDAAINPGNSGGPVVNNQGQVVGVAFQGLTNADSIGYIIPEPIIHHVLHDIDTNGKYTGMVSLGILIQTLRNPMLKTYLGMSSPDIDAQLPEGIEKNGIVVTKVDEERVKKYLEKHPDASADTVGLKRDDVLLALANRNVGEDGSIDFRNVERVAMNYLLVGKYAGDLITATVLRNKKVQEVQVPLQVPKYLVPTHSNDYKPRYVIFGGIVIVPLTKQYILDFKDARNRLGLSTKIDGYQNIFRSDDLEEIVIISRILSSNWTKDYNVQNQQITEVNGVKIKNLTHLAKLIGMIDDEGNLIHHETSAPEYTSEVRSTPDEDKDHSIPGFNKFNPDGISGGGDDLNAVIEIQKVAMQLEKILKRTMRKETDTVKKVETLDAKDSAVKVEEGVSGKNSTVPMDFNTMRSTIEPEYIRFTFEGDNFNFVIEKTIAMVANDMLMDFHNIGKPLYLGDEFKA